jgi:hypothetical protein
MLKTEGKTESECTLASIADRNQDRVARITISQTFDPGRPIDAGPDAPRVRLATSKGAGEMFFSVSRGRITRYRMESVSPSQGAVTNRQVTSLELLDGQ